MIFDLIFIHTFQKQGRPATLRERLDMRKTCGPYQWRPSEPGVGRSFYQSSRGLSCGDSTFDLRLSLANDVLFAAGERRDLQQTTGYYTSSDCSDTMQPIIARLNHARGYLAGWTLGRGMLATLGGEIYDTAAEAAAAAHVEADHAAARERDEEEQQQYLAKFVEEEQERGRIHDAAVAALGRHASALTVEWEHGQYWINDNDTGAQWSVVITTRNNYDFEQVTDDQE